MAKIRIVGVPPGQAPDWVRKEWIGVEIPLVGSLPERGLLIGARGGEPDPRSKNGHTVTLAEALTALRVKSPKAAEWWDNCLVAQVGQKLVFARDVCEVIP